MCQITPSALSKIEAGINSPRANVIRRIAEQLGVTMEYLLDEELPYPYRGHAYRNHLLDERVDLTTTRRLDVTLEEAAFIEALRSGSQIVREIAMSLPEVPMETIRLTHFLLKHSRADNPGPDFLSQFERLLTTGTALSDDLSDRETPARDSHRAGARKPRIGAAERKASDASDGKHAKKPRKKTRETTTKRGGARDRG